jgi:hypothetical protein
MGGVTVMYNGGTAQPDSAGVYLITVNIAADTNFRDTSNLALGKFTIRKAAADASRLDFAQDSSVAYDGLPHGIPVTLKSRYSGMGAIKVKYNDSTAQPDSAGAYLITVDIAADTNFRDTSNLALGTFTIRKATPDTSHLNFAQDSSVTYDGLPHGIPVTLKSRYSGMGAITPEYYNGRDKLSGAPTNVGEYIVKANVAEGANFRPAIVEVGYLTISKATPDTSHLDYVAPANLTYNGAEKVARVTHKTGLSGMNTPQVAYYSGATQLSGAPINVGRYTVKALVSDGGSNFNGDTITLDTFTIVKATPDTSHLSFERGKSVTYNGQKHSIARPTLKPAYTGMGAITVRYNGDTALPDSAGVYLITVDVAENTNFTANAGLELDTLTISKATPDASHLSFERSKSVTYSGQKQGIARPTLKPAYTGMGAITVRYNGSTEPPDSAGVYFITVDVAADTNFTAKIGLALDTFAIAKATPDASHLNFEKDKRIAYDGQKHGVTQPTLKSDYTGMGAVTVKYNGSTEPPNSVGEYEITVDVAADTNFRDVRGLKLSTFIIFPGKRYIDTSITTVYGSAEYIYISIPAESSRTWTTSDSAVAIVLSDERDLIIVNGVGEANLKSFVSDEDGRWLEANLHLKVTPCPLTIEGTWVDTLKSCDGNNNADAIPGPLEGVLPADEGKVFVTAKAQYENSLPDSSKPIRVTYRLEGKRAYCYQPPSPDAGFSGTILSSDGCNGDGGYLDLWGMVVKQAEDPAAAGCYEPWPGVSVAYTINGDDLQKGELQTDSYGRYFLSGLHRGDAVQLTAMPKRGYAILQQQQQTVTVSQSLAKADTISYAPDPLSMASLTFRISDGSALERWEREDITDTIFYQAPCANGQIEISCTFLPSVSTDHTVVSTPVKNVTMLTDENANDSALTLQVEVNPLSRTTISVVSSDSSSEKRYTIVLSKNLSLFDVINERLNGTLRVVQNDPNKNSTGLQFSACTWWHKRDGGLWSVGEEKRLYYTAGSSLLDKFTERDSMFLVLTLTDGTTLETCPDANSVSAASDGSGSGAGKKSMKVAVYPNPVSAGGVVKLKQSDFVGGEDEDEDEERYVKYSLYSAQGSLVLRGDASVFYGGEGLIMPQTPGIYHLLLEGKNGQRQVVKVAVGESLLSN